MEPSLPCAGSLRLCKPARLPRPAPLAATAFRPVAAAAVTVTVTVTSPATAAAAAAAVAEAWDTVKAGVGLPATTSLVLISVRPPTRLMTVASLMIANLAPVVP